MPDKSKTSEIPHAGFELCEMPNRVIFSLSAKKGKGKTLVTQMNKLLDLTIPEIGWSARTADNNVGLMKLQRDQLLIVFDQDATKTQVSAIENLSKIAHLTELSDSWFILKISGQKVRSALERLCPIDLHIEQFPVNKTARTKMEHQAAIIMRQDRNEYVTFTPRSSAKSFLHAIETSILYVT